MPLKLIYWIASVLAGAAAALAITLSTPALARDNFRPEDCRRPLARSTLETVAADDVATQAVIADLCNRASTQARGVEAALSRFYAGRAYLNSGDSPNAIRQLDLAVDLGLDYGAAFATERRAARLALIQAYVAANQLESARAMLNSAEFSPNEPAVAYWRAILALADQGERGEVAAFEALNSVFTRPEQQLLSGPGGVGLTPSEVANGRAWLYRTGMSQAGRLLRDRADDLAQRQFDARQAIVYLRPIAIMMEELCPAPGPIGCGRIGTTRTLPGWSGQREPEERQLLEVYMLMGQAHLLAAGLNETDTGRAMGAGSDLGALGALDCFPSDELVRSAEASRNLAAGRDAFRRLIARASASASGPARWGLACTILAGRSLEANPITRSSQLADAIALLSDAPQHPMTLLTLARAQLLQGSPEAARASFDRALQQFGTNARCPSANQPAGGIERNAIGSSIYLDIARTRLSAFDPTSSSSPYDRVIAVIERASFAALQSAQGDLRCAVLLDGANAEAALMLAHSHIRLAAQPQGASEAAAGFQTALRVLDAFESSAGNAMAGQAEAFFLRSRAITLGQQSLRARIDYEAARSAGPRSQPINTTTRSFREEGRNAVSLAERAYNLTQIPRYREQACLAQILYGDLEGQAHCSASGQGEALVRSLFLEGLYHLRRGQRETNALPRGQRTGVGPRNANWSRSIQSFNRGLAMLEAFPGLRQDSIHPSQSTPFDLSQLFAYGQRYVLTCVNLDAGDTGSAAPEIKQFFWLAGVPVFCGSDPT